jgi:hypothetical protein
MKPKYEPCAGSAPGPFYVVAGGCVNCRGWVHDEIVANEQGQLMDLRGEPTQHFHQDFHCRFYRQPEDDVELQFAIDAVRRCDVDAVRYAGEDKTILDRINRPESCDVMPR